MSHWMMKSVCALSLVSAMALSAPAFANAAAPTKIPGVTVGNGNMMHCPNAVPGAVTKLKDVTGGIEMTVTAPTAAAAKEIRRRAQHMAESAKADPKSVEHNGGGHGGGGIGRCPVVPMNSRVKVRDVKDGVAITLTAKKSVDVQWLRKEVTTRHDADAQPAK